MKQRNFQKLHKHFCEFIHNQSSSCGNSEYDIQTRLSINKDIWNLLYPRTDHIPSYTLVLQLKFQQNAKWMSEG